MGLLEILALCWMSDLGGGDEVERVEGEVERKKRDKVWIEGEVEEEQEEK